MRAIRYEEWYQGDVLLHFGTSQSAMRAIKYEDWGCLTPQEISNIVAIRYACNKI